MTIAGARYSDGTLLSLVSIGRPGLGVPLLHACYRIYRNILENVMGKGEKPRAILELVKDGTGRTSEGKARNRPSDGRLFVNSVSGQTTLPPGLVRGR